MRSTSRFCAAIFESTVAKLQANGIEFLRVPDTYYEELPDRVGQIDEDIDDLKRLGILVDRDDEGYLLQIFTKPVEDRPTVFYEILQRKAARVSAKVISRRSLSRSRKSNAAAGIYRRFDRDIAA